MEWLLGLLGVAILIGLGLTYKNLRSGKGSESSGLDRKMQRFSRLPLDDRQAVFANLITSEIFIQESFYGQTLQEIEQTCSLEKDTEGRWQYRPKSFVFRFGDEVYIPIKNNKVDLSLSPEAQNFLKEKFDVKKLEDLWVWKKLSSSLAQKLNYHYARFDDLRRDAPFLMESGK